MLFLLPILLSVAMYLFYFLFPVRWLTRIPFVLVYGISMYAVLLSSNIFNVGVEKNLQLFLAFSLSHFTAKGWAPTLKNTSSASRIASALSKVIWLGNMIPVPTTVSRPPIISPCGTYPGAERPDDNNKPCTLSIGRA